MKKRKQSKSSKDKRPSAKELKRMSKSQIKSAILNSHKNMANGDKR